jgi:RNA polymerase sigma-70 factor (ECF subfamily)
MAAVRHCTASDEHLLELTARDPEASGAFFDRFEADVLRFFYRALRRPDIAADLTAETFAAALEPAARFSPSLGTARAWLFGIARHELADAWEHGCVEDRARRRLELEVLVLGEATLAAIEELGDAGDALSLLDELPPEQQRAVAGRVLEDRDYAELATAMRCSESVVRQRCASAN